MNIIQGAKFDDLVQGKAPTIINFIKFVARDGLSYIQPYGKDLQVPKKAWRKLESSLVAPGQDTRPAPEVNDPDFKQRTRCYAFAGVDVDEQTSIVTAIYLEE